MGPTMPMERYRGVHGHERVRRISEALERSGATIVVAPDPTIAPFEYRISSATPSRPTSTASSAAPATSTASGRLRTFSSTP